MIWIKGKNKKNHTSWQENQCSGKKSEREMCLLFLLEICSIFNVVKNKIKEINDLFKLNDKLL